MAETIAYMEAVVGADITSFRREMRVVREQVGILSDTIGGLSSLGRSMTYAVTAPIVALGAGAVKMAADFDASMRNVNSIAQLTEAQFVSLSQKTLEFGSATRTGAKGAADALYEAYSAGFQGEAAFSLMSASVKTAEAGLASLDSTTKALAATILSYGQANITASQASDVWTRMVQVGVGSMENFVSAGAQVIPMAASMNVKFEELGGLWAFMTQRGKSASTAAVELNQVMSAMVKPSEDMVKAFKQLGVSSGEELISKFGGLSGAVKALAGTTDGTSTQLAKMFRNIRALRGIQTLTEDVGALDSALADFGANVAGSTMSAWEQQMMSFSAQWDLMTSAIQGAAVAIGQVLMPVITPLINLVKDGALAFMKLDGPTQKLIVSFFALAAAIGPILWLFGSLFSWPALIIGAFGALVTAITTNWNGIRDTIEGAITAVLGDLSGFKDAIDAFLTTLFNPGEATSTYEDYFNALFGVGSTSDMTVAPSTMIEVKEGDTAWSIWNNQFKGQLSWEDFRGIVGSQLEAEGKNFLNIPIGFQFSIDGGSAAESIQGTTRAQIENAFRSLEHQDIAAPQDNSFGARFSAAIEAAWPLLQVALDNMWTNFKTWFTDTALPALDEFAGQGLSKLAAVFLPVGSTGKGDSPVFDAVRSALHGGVGNAVDGIGDVLTGSLPKTTTAFATFFTNVGNWIMNEAIPTIARSLGYVIGTIGTIIGQGLGSIWSSLTGGETAKGVSDVGTVLGEKIGTPFKEGLNQAFSDANITNPADQIATAIAGALGTVAVATILLGGFGTAFGLMFGLITTTTGWIVAGASTIATAISGALAASTIGTKITGAITAAMMGKVVELAPGEFVFTASKGLLSSISASIGGLFTSAMATVTGATAWIVTGVTSLVAAIGAAIAAAPIAIPALILTAAVGIAVVVSEDLRNTIQTALTGNLQEVVANDPTFLAGEIQNRIRMGSIGMGAGAGATELVPGYQQMPLISGEDQALLDSLNNTGKNGAGSFGTGFIEGMTEVAASPELSAATEAITQGMATEIITSFGDGSPARVAWDNFANAVKTGATEISAQVAVLLGTVLTGMPIMTSLIMIMGNAWVSQMKSMFNHTVMLRTVVDGLVMAIRNLTDAAGFLLGLKIEYAGSGAAAGSMGKGFASGGFASGMQLVGERGPELVNFGSGGMVLPTRSLRDALRLSGQGGNSGGNTIVIQGVQDVDAMLFELERRGIAMR